MPNIIDAGDRYKKIIKIAEKWVRKRIGAQQKKVEEDLKYTGNPIAYRLNKLLLIASSNIKEKYQKRMVKNFGQLFLWILSLDTAYRDVFFWVLWKIINTEDIKKELKPYVKEPEDWYVNSWHESKKHTAEQKKEGKISEYRKSEDESIFTPPEQQKKLQKYKSD